MKVLFYEPFAINTPHFERCLELMQLHLDKADEVFFTGCQAQLATCDVNIPHSKFSCQACVQRRDKGLSLLKGKVNIDSIKGLTSQELENVKAVGQKEFDNIEELKAFKFEAYDIGFSVASSLISSLRNHLPDTKEYAWFISKNLKASLTVFYAIKRQLQQNKIDLLYLFNGRYGVLRPAMRAAQQLGIDFKIHERSYTFDKYNLFENALPHDLAVRERHIREHWAAGQEPERSDIGKSFFEKQSSGIVEEKMYNHIKLQEDGVLPENWDDKKMNIAIFNSSDDEFAAIGEEFKFPFYSSQLEGISKVIADLANEPNIHVYLRMHPNLSKVKQAAVQPFLDLSAKNLTIIPPTSKVSTYAIVRNCDKAVTFISSVGIEAAYWGKPSIILGKCFYTGLGSNYMPNSHEEAIELLKQKDLPAKDNIGALMYGYYRSNYGIPYKYYKPSSLFVGQFGGVNITPQKHVKFLGDVMRKWCKISTGMK